MNTALQSFGQRLRLARERLGIPIETIAESTKIKRSLFADLERGDLSKWPSGIYRRAFVREYAAMIGLPPDEVVSEFVDLFPEDGAPAVAGDVQPRRRGELRLTLASDPTQEVFGAARRAAVAIVELCGVLGLGWLFSRFIGWEFWMVSGVIALMYYPIAAACSTRMAPFQWGSVRPLFASSRRHILSGPSLIQLVWRRTTVHSPDEHVA